MMAEQKELILIAENEPEVRSYLEMALRCEGYGVEIAEDGEEALNCCDTGVPISAVLLDVALPKRDGLEVLRELRESGRNLPVILLSGSPSPGVIVEAMRNGATDFLATPVSHENLRRTLDGIFAAGAPRPPDAPGPPAPDTADTPFFGSSLAMRELEAMANLVARSETPVLIHGETGSGKEVLARHLHRNSARARQAFVKLNCAALPSELVESELFGYERGAFTGAFQRKPGMFEVADRGTLLLDEIGDMDFKLQAKLLQVLQDREFQRLGGKETVRVDVRVIAATHNDLEKAIVAGAFRQDLYYRLNVMTLHLPPLRERKEDILPLAAFLLAKHSAPGAPAPEMTAALQRAFLLYDWPGNVRELENVIRKFTVLRDAEMIAQDLMARRHSPVPAPTPLSAPELLPTGTPILEQVTRAKQQAETDAILAALHTTRWNRKKAAALLKIDYKALLYKMKKLGVDRGFQPLGDLVGEGSRGEPA